MKQSANVCVDSGMIMVGDLAYLDTIKKKATPGQNSIGRTFNISIGYHNIQWLIKKTYHGPIEGNENINIKSGTIFICDPCYIIDEWRDWLDITAYGKNINHDGAFIIDSMGGDGRYKVELDIDED